MSLIAELKRRKVFKVGAAYLVIAWIAVQAVSIAFPAFDAPPWALRVFILLAMLGFPLAVVMAWIFDATPEGVKLDATTTGSKRIFAGASVLIALALAWYFYGQPSFRKGDVVPVATTPATIATTAAVPQKSIAVLAFTDLSPKHDQDYFSDGIAEELLNALAQVQDLKVAGRTSSFYYKGRNEDLRTIGKALGVANVLEGSVRTQGDKVRITAQLIRSADGFHLWSETYDGDLNDVFKLQENIARAITEALSVVLSGNQGQRLVNSGTENPEAYAIYLQARAAYRARDMPHSIDLYNAALALDPKFAPAWANLCGSKNLLQFYLPQAERAKIPKILEEAESACKKAIALAPDLASPQIMLANLYSNEWRWREAEGHYLRAEALAPSDPEFYFSYTDFLGSQGRTEEALAAAQRAVELDPMAPMYRNLYGYLLRYAGRPLECLAQMQAGYALAPSNVYLNQNLITCYVATGRVDDAKKLHHSLRNAFVVRGENASTITKQMAIQDAIIAIARHPDQYAAITKPLGEDGMVIALVYPTHIDELFDYVGQQIDQHRNGSDGVILLRSSLFAQYHSDTRYLRLLRKAGFDDQGNIR